jgi:Glycosyltransferase family 87
MNTWDTVLFRWPFWLVLGAVLCAAGGWLYVQRVLVAHQIADAAVHGTPRGNLSDLYPRWLGARELLLRGRDPYSSDVTREIQAGYYGRPLDPSRPADPKDQQAFAYPVYVVFYLAPTVHLPFRTLQKAFFWLLIGLTLGSVSLWLRALQWPVAAWVQAVILALTLGSVPVLQGLKLQQLSLLVAALLAAAVALLSAGRPLEAGVFLAMATMKPQLVLPLLLWLGIWSIGDWRHRYRWMVSFLLCMTALVGASELWLPHWIARFWHAIGDYWQYTHAQPMLESLLTRPLGGLLEILFSGAVAIVCWRQRRQEANTHAFQAATCLVMVLTVLTMPTFSLYNQVLLLPAVLLLARDRKAVWGRSLIDRALLILLSALLAWPYVTSTVLAGLSFGLPPDLVQRGWALPGWTVLMLPVGVAAPMLLHGHRESFVADSERVPS